MSKHLMRFLGGFILSFNTICAQIEIQMKDYAREGIYYYGNRMSAGLSPGLSGKNQVWDFSSFTAQTYDTIIFKGYHQKGNGNHANMIKMNGSLDTLEWLNRNPEWVSTIIPLYLIDTLVYRPLLSIKFPSKYQDKIKDSLRIVFTVSGVEVFIPEYDSIRVEYQMWLNNFVDGEGILKLGLGNFPALRMQSQTKIEARVFGKNGSDTFEFIPDESFEQEYTQYHYLSPDFGYSAAVLDVELSTLSFSIGKVLNLKESDLLFPAELIYENPINDRWKIRNQGLQKWEITIMDMLGKSVRPAFELKELESIEIPTELLSDGVYLVKVRNKFSGKTYIKKAIK